jgi:integrase
VTDITTDRIRDYIEAGKKAGVTGSTIRRSLAVLRTMYNQSRKEGKLRLADVPYFPMPKEGKARQGFVEPGVFESVRAALPKNLRPLITFIYFTGCRKGAAKRITWPMVAKDCSEIMLPGEITKSGEPLLLPLTGPLEQVASVLRKMFRTGGPVFDATNLRKEWNAACHTLGLGKYENELYSGLTLHDLRRSAVRNLIRAGVSRGIAMQITGHKTEHVFERYNIVDTTDIREALIKVGEYAAKRKRTGDSKLIQKRAALKTKRH